MAGRPGSKLRDHTILALDIGSRFIKVAEMRLTRGGPALLNVAVRPTPPHVLNSSQILDPVGLGRAVKELLITNKIKTRRVVTAVAGQSSVVVRPIDLPKMSRQELANTMKFEVERHIPFTADEVVMDYSPLVESEELPEAETNMKVLLAVAQEELIMAYLKMLSAAGLQPVVLDVEILAAIRSMVDIHSYQGAAPETLALVNIGAVSTDISIVDDGKLIFTRSVPIAGNTLTEAIADQLARDFDDAEEMKKEHGRVFLEGHAGGAEQAAILGQFDVGDEGAPAPAAPAAPAPAAQPFFSLEDDFSAPTPGVQPSALPPIEPITPSAPSSGPIPFDFDDDVDDDIPMLRLDGNEEEQVRRVPTYELEEDDVDDDVEVSPALHAEEAPRAAGPVFDLSSELEEQMPAPLSRPTLETPPAEPAAAAPFTFTSTPEPTPAAPAPAFAESQPTSPPSLIPSMPAEAPTAPVASMPSSEGGDTSFQHRIFEAMLPTLVELVTEIRRSLEYYSSREPETPVQRMVIYGGTSRLPNLAQFFQTEIGLDVQLADPIMALDLAGFRQPQEYLQELAPALPICIGLGLRDMIE